MADFPAIPAGFGIPLVDMATYLFPEPTMDAFAALTEEAIDPIGFRVVGLTGSGDETAKIQDAMDRATTFGAAVILPPGTFTVTDLVMPIQGMKLYGASAGGTTLKASASAEWILQTTSFSTVRDLKFDLANYDAVALDIYTTSRLLAENLYIQSGSQTDGIGIRYHGIDGSNSAHANRLTNIMILSVGTGILGESWCYDNEMVNVWVGTCGDGIRMSSGSHLLTNIHVWGCDNNGLEFYGSGGGESRVVNAYLETNGGYGLRVASNSTGNSFVGVRLWRNGTGGSYVNGGSDSRFSACWADENTGSGFLFTDHTDAVLTACSAYDNQGTKTQTYGLRSTGTSDRIIATACNMQSERHLTGGYSIVGSGNRISLSKWRTSDAYLSVGYGSLGAGVSMEVATAAGNNRDITFLSGTSSRWIVRVSSAAESGSDAGSNFDILARTDAGGALGTALSIVRARGQVTFPNYPAKQHAAATGSRPAAGTAGAGAHMFDTTLGKPIWSDGSNWKDATGTTV